MHPPPQSSARFAVFRYRVRLVMLRVLHSRPRPLDLINFVLAVIGAWSVVASLLRWVARFGSEGSRSWAVFIAVAFALALVWFRLTRSPQDIFRVASRSEVRAEALRRWMVAGMRNQAAYDSVAALYARLVDEIGTLHGEGVNWPDDRNGRRCLVVTIRPREETDIGDVVTGRTPDRDRDWTERTSNFAAGRQMYMSTIRRSPFDENPFGDEEGDNLVLDDLQVGARISMVVSTASYGQIVRTSESLVNEFAFFGYLSERSAFRGRSACLRFSPDDLLRVLPWRRSVHAWDDGVGLLLSPRGRAAGLGVSAVVLASRNGVPHGFVARRSVSVGTYPDVLHVIPSGMMNLHDSAGTDELRALPELAMTAEFLEECFNLKEFAGHSLPSYSARVNRELEARGLAGMHPVFTGIAVDLLNLRAEVCGIIDLTDHADVIDDFEVSWEYSHNEPPQRIDVRLGASGVDRTDFVQSGIGSIDLASRWLAR